MWETLKDKLYKIFKRVKNNKRKKADNTTISPSLKEEMSNMRVKDIRPAPAEIEYKNMKFLITDRPNDQTIPTFIQVSMQNSLLKI